MCSIKLEWLIFKNTTGVISEEETVKWIFKVVCKKKKKKTFSYPLWLNEFISIYSTHLMPIGPIFRGFFIMGIIGRDKRMFSRINSKINSKIITEGYAYIEVIENM